MANYGLTFTVDAPYLLKEGVDVDDFPVPVKIPIANTSNLYGTGETADTIYFECEGEILKHELIAITDTYLYAWIKMDLEAFYKKIVTLHYGPLVDNNYEDKRGVWVNGVNIYHFYTDGTDTMGVNNLTPTANVVFGTGVGNHNNGVYIPAGHGLTGVEQTATGNFTVIVLGLTTATAFNTHNYILAGLSATTVLLGSHASNADKFFRHDRLNGYFSNVSAIPSTNLNVGYTVTGTVASPIWYINNSIYDSLTVGTPSTTPTFGSIGKLTAATYSDKDMSIGEVLLFSDTKSPYWVLALQRLYKNPSAYIEYGTEVDLDNLTDFTDEKVCCIANIVRQLEIYDYDFKKMVYEVGAKNAYWRVPGSGEGIYVWGKLEMRPLYGEDVSFVDNLYANDAYFYTFTDYTYDIHDKLDVEGVLYDIQAIQVHDAGSETIYKTLVLKRQPEYYACCVGIVS